jgi:glycosyltransferase involved in cell wall biosynthesis
LPKSLLKLSSINFSSAVSKNNFLGRGFFSKISYLKRVPELKLVINRFKPDVLHAHYASSYGLLGSLCKFSPFVISAWGSDVMDFPNKSFLHKAILKFNLRKADAVLATSNAIVNSIRGICDKPVQIIPFGIDTSIFKPQFVERMFDDKHIVIGTIKSLEEIYGIDILIKAFKKVLDNNPVKKIKLLIVGGGSREAEYKDLVNKLGISRSVVFTGKVEYAAAVNYHNMIDIFVNVSRNESFGVSVLEASACEKPVIVADVGGLGEVVLNNKTGFIIQKENVDETAAAIEKLMDDNLRSDFGKRGREFVMGKYEFQDNLQQTIDVYKSLVPIKE